MHMKNYKKNKIIIRVMLFCCLFFVGVSAFAQQKTITGTVTDETGETLIGATVMVQGSSLGVMTDVDGKYSIQASQGDMLNFTYVGMESQSIKVGTNPVISVVLKELTNMLTETVVIGYGSARKRDLTGSIASIKGSDIADLPSSNPVSSIQGKVAGVQITNSGKAGEAPDVRIRGTNSINGGKPLYVVDGLFNDNINFLNPADVESMEILKDPSSLAIFGVRGANGVIIVTTKSAKEGKTVVSINSSVGAKIVPNKMEMTNAMQFKELYNEQRINEGITTPYDYTNWQANTDWQDEIFQTGLVTNNNISISGANDRSKFYMGVGYSYEDGIIKNENMNRITINLNNEYKVTDDLKFGFQVSGYKANLANYKSVTPSILAAPISSVYNNEYGLYYSLPDFQRSQVANPMVDVELRKNTSKPVEYRAIGNLYADWTFLKDFNFRASFSADYGVNLGRTYSPLIAVYNPDIVNAAPIDSLSKQTSVNQYQNLYTKTQTDFLLTYKKQINEDHGLTLTGGFTTYFNSYTQIDGARMQGTMSIPDYQRYWYLSIGDPSTATNGSGQWSNSTTSVLFRALYNYQNKYLLNGSFRRDGSSQFSYTNNTWQNFGALGAGWVISSEEFMKDQHVFDYLKLKGSWGVLGSQNIDEAWRYPAFPEMENTASGIFGPDETVYPGYTPKYLADPDLEWEKNYSWETGFEAYLLRNQLRVEAVYYNKLTKGFLAIVPGVSGTIPGLSNVGDIQNKGIEASASWNSTIGSDWTYSVSANITTLNNKVKNYTGVPVDMAMTADGYPIAFFFGYKSAGIYQTQAEIDQSPENTMSPVKPGDIRFQDVDGDDKITTADRTMIGNPTPDFTYGGSITVGYKGIDLTVDVMGVYGNEIFKDWNRLTYGQFNYQIQRMDRWHGVGTSNWEPSLNSTNTNAQEYSDYYIEDGSFFRIRNIQLGYNFKPEILKSLKIQSLRLYVNAQNPITFANNTGFTPEIYSTSAVKFGVDSGTYPLPAIYTFGINLNF